MVRLGHAYDVLGVVVVGEHEEQPQGLPAHGDVGVLERVQHRLQVSLRGPGALLRSQGKVRSAYAIG